MDLARSRELLPDAAMQWISDAIEIREEDKPLGRPRVVKRTQLSLLSDRSFAAFEQAWRTLCAEPLPEATNVFWNQTLLDVLFEYPIRSGQARFSIHPALARLGQRVVTVLRFLPPGGAVRASNSPATRAWSASIRAGIRLRCSFVRLGFFHILDGTDHLLFLFCLVIPFRRFWALVPVVTRSPLRTPSR